MRKPDNILRKGLMGLVVGAGAFGLGGCEEPQGNYNDNQQQSRNDAGQAGLDLLQFTLGLYGVTGDGTPQQRNAAGYTANLIGQEKRNDAIRKSGTTVNVYNGRPQRQRQGQVYRQQPIAQIERVWVDYDSLDESGNKGMKIHSKFKTWNMRGERIRFAAYFYNINGLVLKDRDGQYSSVDRQVSTTGRILSPNFDNTLYEDETMFMPYNQLDLIDIGKQDLKFQVILWKKDTEVKFSQITKSDFVNFWANN